jgi:hypothetical protein
MKLADSFGAVQCGTQVINRVRVPVFRLPCGTEVVEQADLVNGQTEIISVEGAKRFKAQPYAFHPDIEPVIVDGVFSRPLALSEAEERDEGETILRALFGRVLDSGQDFVFMPSVN